jgi:hypothetical protein
MFTEEAPGEGDLLETFRQLSPIMRKTALKILRDILVAQQDPAPSFTPFPPGVSGRAYRFASHSMPVTFVTAVILTEPPIDTGTLK